MESLYAWIKNWPKKEHLLLYKLESNDDSLPEVTQCIRVGDDLLGKLFYKSIPVHLSVCFTKGRNMLLSSFNMISSFISYLKNQSEEYQEILTELNNLKYYSKWRRYFARLVCCDLHPVAPYNSSSIQALVRRAALFVTFPFLLETVNCW